MCWTEVAVERKRISLNAGKVFCCPTGIRGSRSKFSNAENQQKKQRWRRFGSCCTVARGPPICSPWHRPEARFCWRPLACCSAVAPAPFWPKTSRMSLCTSVQRPATRRWIRTCCETPLQSTDPSWELRPASDALRSIWPPSSDTAAATRPWKTSAESGSLANWSAGKRLEDPRTGYRTSRAAGTTGSLTTWTVRHLYSSTVSGSPCSFTAKKKLLVF